PASIPCRRYQGGESRLQKTSFQGSFGFTPYQDSANEPFPTQISFFAMADPPCRCPSPLNSELNSRTQILCRNKDADQRWMTEEGPVALFIPRTCRAN